MGSSPKCRNGFEHLEETRMTDNLPLIRLLVLRSAKIEAMLAFYTTIGLRFEQEQHGTGPKHYSAQIGGMVFELYPLGNKDAGDTTTRLGITVDDLGKTLDRLKAVSAVVSREPEATPWGRRAVVRDPDGRSIELYEQPKKEC
jgi:predicted enzyme related to lactoylglutathione lyase